MGHAGPNGIPGWLSLTFNFPGFIFVGWVISWSDADMSWAAVIGVIFITQTALWCYAIFVLLRWIKVKA